jgi:hypothetical protein
MKPSFWRKANLRTAIGLSVLSTGGAMSYGAHAHPVVFADGTAIMGHHHGKMSGLEIVYSPNWYTGFGLEVEKSPKHSSLLGRASYLAWRGNFPDLQTNLYLTAAAGKKWQANDGEIQSRDKQHLSSLAQWNVEWDAEDRDYYGRIKYAQHFETERQRNDETLVRIGFAPYKANADEPAIWGMLEWKSKSNNRFQTAEHDVTPLMRYFYKNALFEVGSSLSGKFAFNYMYHFF